MKQQLTAIGLAALVLFATSYVVSCTLQNVPDDLRDGGTITGAVVFNSTTQAATLNTLQLADPDGDSGLFWNADDDLRLRMAGSSIFFFGPTTFTTGATMQLQGGLTLSGIDVDVDGTCNAGQWEYDIGGATDEICYCVTTNTPMCVTVAAGPTD